MELTTDKLVGYYPYDLKVLEIFDIGENQIRSVFAISQNSVRTNLQRFPYTQEISFARFKLILFPLSDLTKAKEINGDKFVPIVKLLESVMIAVYGSEAKIDKECWYCAEPEYYGIKATKDNDKIGFSFRCENEFMEFIYTINGNEQKLNQLQLFQKLYEWHFDIHNLTENGLAIDVNSLNKNPYK